MEKQSKTDARERKQNESSRFKRVEGAKAHIRSPMNSMEFLRLGGTTSMMPPELIVELAQSIGNSALLELMGEEDEADTTVFTLPQQREDAVANHICTSEPVLTTPIGLLSHGDTTLRPFPVNDLQAREQSTSDMNLFMIQDGANELPGFDG